MQEVKTPSVSPDESWRPFFFRLTENDVVPFAALCLEQRIAVKDEIDRQLADLAVIRFPPAEQQSERERFVADAIEEHGGRLSFGTWSYFPWEAKVVHILDCDDYFDVITNRNQDKITRDEQQQLRHKRIGVVGLSVGGEAAVTVAQEHLCGHIVLADFDRLDLSNLNRLNAGCDDLGLLKTTIVARRIVKINPYLEITVFEKGVTESNVELFLAGLDLLIEECDNLQLKREIRQFAKKRELNVVYAADERGFLSVEPYQYCPDLLPFHGRVEHPQLKREDYRTTPEFMRALSEWMGGWDCLSERSRNSLGRVGDALCGYPQLASEARYAAGQVGHVARKLLLDERIAPYFGNSDIDYLMASFAQNSA